MMRRMLSDRQWALIERLAPGKPGDRGRQGRNNRLFVEAVPWVARQGATWRALPPEFGRWNTVFVRVRRWVLAGVWRRLFEALHGDPDFEYVSLDSTIVRVHRDGAGGKGGRRPRQSAAPAAA